MFFLVEGRHMPQEKMKTQGAWEVYHLCIYNPQEDVHHNKCGDLSSLSIIIKKRCTATNVDKEDLLRVGGLSFSLLFTANQNSENIFHDTLPLDKMYSLPSCLKQY